MSITFKDLTKTGYEKLKWSRFYIIIYLNFVSYSYYYCNFIDIFWDLERKVSAVYSRVILYACTDIVPVIICWYPRKFCQFVQLYLDEMLSFCRIIGICWYKWCPDSTRPVFRCSPNIFSMSLLLVLFNLCWVSGTSCPSSDNGR